MGEIEKSTYKELLKNMNKVQKWLESIGIETEDTRFIKSKKNCMVIKNYYENNNINSIDKEMKYEEINETFSACMDYISIYRNLSKFDKNHLPKRKIKESLVGPFLKKDEVGKKGDNYARNILFELEMASLLLRSKIKVEEFNDVKFKFNSYKFYIECKRPLSNNSVKDNMDKAYNQLNNKLKDEKDRGIIAISLDKVIGKEKNIISKILLAKNKSDLLYREANLVDNFVREHQNIWHNFNHSNIIGIFFRFNFMSFLKEENILIQRYGLTIKGLYRTFEDECLLKELGTQLDKYC